MLEHKKENHLESATKLFAFLYVLLTSCGIANRYFYYRRFGISITEYLDVSEIMLLFIPLITNTVLIVSIFFFILLLINKNLLSVDSKILNPQVVKYNNSVVKSISFFAIGALIILFILAKLSVISFYTFYTGFAAWVVIFLAYHLEIIFIYLDKNFNINIPEIWRNSLYVFIVFLTSSMYTGYSSSYKMEIKSIKEKVEISFKDSSMYKSDSANLYLGRTKGFIFFYDKTSKTTIVLSSSEVKDFKVLTH